MLKPFEANAGTEQIFRGITYDRIDFRDHLGGKLQFIHCTFNECVFPDFYRKVPSPVKFENCLFIRCADALFYEQNKQRLPTDAVGLAFGLRDDLPSGYSVNFLNGAQATDSEQTKQ